MSLQDLSQVECDWESRAFGSEQWALRIWNPVVTNHFSRQCIVDFAASVGLSYLRTVEIPLLVTDGQSHANVTLLLFHKSRGL
jgi:hypothetical protein